MPARANTSARRGRASGDPATRTSNRKLAVRGRNAATAVEPPDEGPETLLRREICKIFSDSAKSIATHRKLGVHLRKIQEMCCWEQQNPKREYINFMEFTADEFEREVGRCIKRVLPVKKGEAAVDRIIRFLGEFLQRANAEDTDITKLQIEEDDEEQAAEKPTYNLTNYLLEELIPLASTKEKTVRYRTTQVISEIVVRIRYINAGMEEDLRPRVRHTLGKRIRDKEAIVRVQAVRGFARIADDVDIGEKGDLYVLADIMAHDPSADVRREILLNMPFDPSTLKEMLERARDTDAVIRRDLYTKVLPLLGDFRHMTLTQREKLVRWGLRDREKPIQDAASKMFRERWIENCAGVQDTVESEPKAKQGFAPPSMDALLELLERIDVTTTGLEGSPRGIAHEAMKEFWDGRPDYREFVTFDQKFWEDLTPEAAFVLRSFNDYCLEPSDGKDKQAVDAALRRQRLLDDKMPDMTTLAMIITNYLNKLLDVCRQLAERPVSPGEDEEDPLGEHYVDIEFVVSQLLHVAQTLDYSTDEVGRQQIYNLMRDALAKPELPADCTQLAVGVLRAACGPGKHGLREFVDVVKEAIDIVRDSMHEADDDTVRGASDGEEESFHSAQSDVSGQSDVGEPKKKKARREEEEDSEALQARQAAEISILAKCLDITEYLLQNVDSEQECRSTLRNILDNYVTPACHSKVTMIRVAGVKCLGLMAILDKVRFSNSNLHVFLHCSRNGAFDLKIAAINTIADIFRAHPDLLSPNPDADASTTDITTFEESATIFKTITKALLQNLSDESTDDKYKLLPIAACKAACAFLTFNILPPPYSSDLLKAFIIAYFDPEESIIPAIRQPLTYTIPVFCHSRHANALLLAEICAKIVHDLFIKREQLQDLDEDAARDMVSWSVVAAHLAEWTDARRVYRSSASKSASGGALDGQPPPTTEEEEEARAREAAVRPSLDPHILLAITLLEKTLSHGVTAPEKKALLSLLVKLYVDPVRTEADQSDEDQDVLRTLMALAREAVESRLGTDVGTRNAIAKLAASVEKRVGDLEEEEEEEGEAETTVVERRGASRETEMEDAESVLQGDEEDTMMADVQAEGTRMPLMEDDEDEDETIRDRRESTVVTESDIVDSLLESEIE
ncbi:hypothetical protein M011DRAFT_451690 [Sporormia fimetaria CBS 119925]|uniref:Nuclear condensin complex subunit 3 C-terminal domain-containing protein n=1 Tax=Sporormia fimetaria CBS 119925 TaxID=1340428 RepID=A0A6A6V092_9PLEO|nr:hypothetical protein M011DRAFT_451690 [Sporormia fimetaria CBS 119925]